jgi:hypothetical protein
MKNRDSQKMKKNRCEMNPKEPMAKQKQRKAIKSEQSRQSKEKRDPGKPKTPMKNQQSVKTLTLAEEPQAIEDENDAHEPLNLEPRKGTAGKYQDKHDP